MPDLTRWFIKTALIYLVLALLIGALVALYPIGRLPPWIAALSPVYVHLLTVGWVTQMIFGVAYWMFPKYSRESPRGNETLWQTSYWSLNAGLVMRIIGEPMQALQPQAIWGWSLVLSAALQWLAGLAFVFNTWRRVRER